MTVSNRKQLATLLTMVVATGAMASMPLSADDVLMSVQSKGARSTVQRIWSSPQQTREFLDGVASGNDQWLRAAESLASATDAGSVEDLDDAFARALPRNPHKFLPWLKHYWWHDNSAEVCVFGYDSELPGGVTDYVANLEAALMRSHPHHQFAVGDECLRGIKKTRASLESHKAF